MTPRQCLIPALTALTACASAGSVPVLEHRPVGPLTYRIVDESAVTASPPGMEFRNATTTTAAVRLELRSGGETPAVRVVYESLLLETSGDMDNGRYDGEAFVGAPFDGALSPTGALTFASGPDIPASILRQFDPAAFLATLLPPLPPGGADAPGSWPHRVTIRDRTELETTSRFLGTAAFAGDTVWNGRPALLIASRGTAEIEGSGTPPGAPGPVEMVATAAVTTRYVWDPERGVLLASVATAAVEGQMDMGGLVVPVTVDGSTRVELQQ